MGGWALLTSVGCCRAGRLSSAGSERPAEFGDEASTSGAHAAPVAAPKRYATPGGGERSVGGAGGGHGGAGDGVRAGAVARVGARGLGGVGSTGGCGQRRAGTGRPGGQLGGAGQLCGG